MILKMDDKLTHYQKEYKKMTESNQRNIKRLIRHRTRFQELVNHRNEPEYFLHICGFMNEYMQEFMLTHDVHIMNVNEGPNPDNMSYEVHSVLNLAIALAWGKHRESLERDIEGINRKVAPSQKYFQRA